MKKFLLLIHFVLCIGLFVYASEETNESNGEKLGTSAGYKNVSVGGFWSSYHYIEVDGYIYLKNDGGCSSHYGIAYVGPKNGFRYEYTHESTGFGSSYDYIKANEHIYLRNSSGTDGGYGIAHAGICPCKHGKKKVSYKNVSVGGFWSSYHYIEVDGYIYLKNDSGCQSHYGIAYVGPKKGFRYEYTHESTGFLSSYDYIKANEHIYLRNSNGTEGGYGIAHAGICPCRKKK